LINKVYGEKINITDEPHFFLVYTTGTLCRSRQYPYLPHGRDFFLDPHSPLKPHKFLSFFFFRAAPAAMEIPSAGGVWIFSGTAHFAFCPKV